MGSGIGQRIHVVGNSCSGKSTLAERLGKALSIPAIDLDVINWQPDWVGLNATDPEEFERRIKDATSGEAFAVAGSYMSFSQRAFWSKLETVIWLDLPLPQLVWRVLSRTWRRWRSRELLWGTNYEQFWPQFKVWDVESSLLGWILYAHYKKRRRMLEIVEDPQWSHISFFRVRSSSELEAFLESHSIQAERP